jgi:hypothetical protein
MSGAAESVPNTPTLESGVLPRRKPAKHFLGFIVGFLTSLLFAAVVGAISTNSTHTSVVLFLYLPILMLTVVLHELGHVAAGVAVGFHFSSISIGPFSIGLIYGRVTFQIRAQSGALGYAGMHTQTVSNLRRNLFLFVMAGPLMNLVSGTLAAIFVLISPQTLRSSWLIALSAAFSTLSLLVFVLSAIPFRSTFHSDGDRIRMLVKSPAETRRWISAMALASQQRKGIRPRRWKQTWLQAVCRVRDSSFDEFFGNLLAYIAASDRKDAAEQARHLERCLELSHVAPVMSRDLIACESSYFCAWTRCDLKLAKSWLSQLENRKPITPLIGIRTEIALACAGNNFDDALSLWQKGIAFIGQLPSTRIKETLEESWREWGIEITQRSDQLVTK